ncbi:DUF2345 domain-containing protein, partial [Commensalibacter nepenthis]
VVFSDDQSKYVFGNSLPIRNPAGSGMNDNAILSVWGIKVHHNLVQAGAKVKDYNYRTANATQNSQTDSWQPDQTTYGVPYHYGDRYLERGADIDPEIETGSFHARLHNERYKNNQVRITGKTNDPSLYPGKVLDLEGGSEDPALKYGFLIVSTTNKGSRNGKYEMSFEAIPYSDQIGFRPKLLERPHIAGTIPARVSSTEKFDTYSHIDEMGRYKVYFDFDLDTWDKGKESLWVRLAKPYSGGTYGFHWPLLDGTEVAIAFEDGDPDRPYIAYALHDSANGDHVTIQNYKRNVLRTPSNNKLRMEDERGKEHIKLSTEYGGKTQLNMGHLVDSSRQKRGEGFELRTDKWGAIRANNGIFISADGRQKASSTSLDMIEATGQLSAALNQAKQLREAADASKATGLDTSNLMTLIESAITMLQQASVLISAPAGIAQTTPSTIQHNAGRNVITTAGKDVSLNAKNNVTMAASEEISLFAHNKDLRAVAGYGKVELQAQSSQMNLDAKMDITLTSHDGKIQTFSPKEINLICGAKCFIKLTPDQVIMNAPDHIIHKTAVVIKQNPGSMPIDPPLMPQPISKPSFKFSK